MNTYIDITSSVAEKGIELPRDFFDKIIGPSMAESGLCWKIKSPARETESR